MVKKTAKKAAKAKKAAPATQAAKAPTTVTMLLNGQTVGVLEPGTQSIAEAGAEIARKNGLKTYSILIDGTKVSTEDGNRPIAGHVSIEVFAKEARG
jgi:hypothetical protein